MARFLFIGFLLAQNLIFACELNPTVLPPLDFKDMEGDPQGFLLLLEAEKGAKNKSFSQEDMEDLLKISSKKSKKIGNRYLWGRFLEYLFTTASVSTSFLVGFSPQALVAVKVLGVSGKVCGEIGNGFQTYQGVIDLALAKSLLEPKEKSEKLKFAKLALCRGSINCLADACGLVGIFYDNQALLLTGVLTGASTDLMGGYKNYFDTKKNQGSEKMAYLACFISRFFFIASACSAVMELSGIYPSTFPSRVLGLCGYFCFNLGALKRQHHYHTS